MGINIHAGVSYLYSRYHSYKDFEGRSCLMLGVQTIDSDGFEFFKAAGRMGFELMPDVYKLTRREMMRAAVPSITDPKMAMWSAMKSQKEKE